MDPSEDVVMSPLEAGALSDGTKGLPETVYVHHKILPLKHADGEPLTREDIQHDLLYHIFQDPNACFTDQTPDAKQPGPYPKVTFCELYVNSILNSPKCTKVARDKMIETPSYAVEFAKMCLLVNVGRINTTLAFYHEMRTILRSYHSVPSLMKSTVSERNMMDAPRMKACLKGCLLHFERQNPAATPEEVLQKIEQGHIPPTNIVNLIFILANHVTPFSRLHFDPSVDFLDLFVPINISSALRAKAFLWTMFHYLEGPGTENPFSDIYASSHPGKAPWLPRITNEQMHQENIDTPEEIEFSIKMKTLRIQFLKQLAAEDDTIKKVEEPKYIARFEQQKEKKRLRNSAVMEQHQQQQQMQQRASSSTDIYSAGRRIRSPIDHPALGPNPSRYSPVHDSYQMSSHQSSHVRQSQPSAPPPASRYADAPRYAPSVKLQPEDVPQQNQSALQFAWSATWNLDPLADSDDEIPNERNRSEYERRLWVLNRLRGRDLTLPPEEPQEGYYMEGVVG